MTRQEIDVQTGNEVAPAIGECEAPPLTISLFGPFEVRRKGRPLPRLRTRKGYALLALLAIRHGGPVERSWLAGTLWPQSSEAQALANLRNSLKDLRRALGEEAGRLSSPAPRTLRLELGGAAVDLLAFDTAVARGDAVALAEAAALYRGPLLEGWTDEWVFQERQPRETAYLAALETLAERALAQHEPEEAEQYLRRAVTTDPLRERAQRGLMRALAAGGSYAGAIEAYRDLRLLLHRELNAEPDAETAALFQQIRAESRQRALPGRTLDDGRSPVGVTSFSTSPCHRAASPPHNLPRQLTRFIGREREMAEARRLLSTAALLTVTGAGGCGKTRLALQVALDLLPHYRDGVWLVELASLSEPALVTQSVASVLRVHEEPGRPLSQTLAAYLQPRSLLLVLDNCEHLLAACAALAETLLRACPDLRILATSREVLGIAGEQAYRVPSLSLPDPRPWRRTNAASTPDHRFAAVPPRGSRCPLAVPSLERVLEFDAVRLFVDRAAMSQPTFAMTPTNTRAVVQVCQRLDGIPLAIELAAARVRALSVEKLNERLDDMFGLLTRGSRTALPRHQTLRALIDWSYNLLSPSERALLGRLSVFAGGWTLEAAEAVGAGDGIEPGEVLDLLTQLVDKSLVVYEAREEDRYRLLETVRQYARDRLLESGEMASARGRHLDWCVDLAERAGPELFGREQATWLGRLEREHENLRAALDWSLESGAVEAGLRIGAAVWRFWSHRYIAEGRERLAALLSRPEASERTRVRAKALDGAAVLALVGVGGDRAAARSHYGEMLAIGRELGDDQVIAAALNGLGHVANQQGDCEQARPLLEQGLAHARAAGDRWEAAFSIIALGNVAARNGDYRAAWSLYEEALATRRELGDNESIGVTLRVMALLAMRQGDYRRAEALFRETLPIFEESSAAAGAGVLRDLGVVALVQGDYAAARSHFEECLVIAREGGNQGGIATALGQLARVALCQGDFEAARSLSEESLATWQELGHHGASDPRYNLAEAARYRGDYAAAHALYEECLALAREGTWDRRSEIARSLLGLGVVAQKQGDGERAKALCRESLMLSRQGGQKLRIAICLEAIGSLAGVQGQPRQAARLLGAAAALRELLDAPLPPVDRPAYERSVAAAQAALGEEAFNSVWAQGRALSLDEAITLALRDGDEGAPNGADP